MTVDRTGRRISRGDPSDLGPVGTTLGQVYVSGTVLYSFGVLYDRLPPLMSIVLLVPAAACLVLAPRRRVLAVRVSLPMLCLLGWLVASWLWSASPAQTFLRLWTLIPLLLGLIVVTSLLRMEHVVVALRWTIRIALLLVVATLLTQPASRVSGSDAFRVAGWRGSFVDKNSMALFLVFALATTLALDRRRNRWLTMAMIIVLLLGSSSATGMSGAGLVVVLYVWLHLLRKRAPRRSSAFIASSAAVAATVAVGVGANLASILEIYGKDPNLTGRTEIWAAVAGAIRERPALGYGLGGPLNVNSPSAVTLELWRSIGFEAAHAHNGVLDLVGQVGLIGLAIYLFVAGATIAGAWFALRRSPMTSPWVLVTVSAQLLMSVSENVLLGPWLVVLVLLQVPSLLPPDRLREHAGSAARRLPPSASFGLPRDAHAAGAMPE